MYENRSFMETICNLAQKGTAYWSRIIPYDILQNGDDFSIDVLDFLEENLENMKSYNFVKDRE